MAESRLIHDRYRLLDLIGRGGMGEVWRSRDESLGRRVAVKCLKPLGPQRDSTFLPVLRERFRREARVAASLQHRGVTVVHDFGEDDGVLYLVMELLDGRNLRQLLDEHKQQPLPVPEVVDIAEQMAVALAYTHGQGVVHRDLKPANIMRLTDGTVKVCDFGIARLGHDIDFTARLTGTGLAMGTPQYMSPEQIEGDAPIDHRSDLYSLGCVLYELATGAPPFDGADAWSVLVGHRDTPPVPPRRQRPELPEPFERMVLDLLAKEPDQRPQDAADLGGPIGDARAEVGDRWSGGARFAPGGGTAPPPLPAWARSLTTGSKAGAAHRADSAPAPVADGLTGVWTGHFAPGPPVPPTLPDRPLPPPGLLESLAARHRTGLELARLGRWEESGAVHRSVAAEREHALGPDHPDTLASRYEIAYTLSRAGRPADALREYGRVSAGLERVLGPEHPDTLAARQETAYVLGLLGRHLDAQQVYTAVLAARERTMGPEHPETLRCRHNLAFTLGRLGRLEDSYTMAAEVAAARARVLGPDHPDTLVTRYEVAHALGRLSRWPEALHQYREVAAARARALGADHPDTLAARYELGISLGRLGHGAEALAVCRDLVADRTRTQGPDHPETLRARHGLGVNLGSLGRWEEALAEAREVCAIRERTLGPDHPDTLVSRREIAVGLGWLGRWADALTLYQQVARARERVLGTDHPDAITSRTDEAQCLDQLGRREEAVEIYQQAAALRGRAAPSAPRDAR
ncbi:serine/threonine-protein kinase [Streptomyces palmae]|uniref:non-specific serine/threonine protein kinase n=1 Tax=Streptomyces palmae TaxID=1701085 RepID=A0A4Z0H1P2_9ACTN|nr:serine/threonine-protein kinase [Streptomyces palmae]TGB02972.1 serine/threonine protein kinase [Streptomyces palmae]